MEHNPMRWGHYAALVILAACAAAYRPHYLLYVGLLRFVWCVLGGRPGRGMWGAFVFGIAYLCVTLPTFLEEESNLDTTTAPAAHSSPADLSHRAP